MSARKLARAAWAWVAGVAAVRPAAAAEQEQVATAAERINAATIARHVAALSTDSLRGRATPSPELEAAARYVVTQFQRLGLQPFGDHGEWIQRYPLPGQLRFNYARSALELWQLPQHRGTALLGERG